MTTLLPGVAPGISSHVLPMAIPSPPQGVWEIGPIPIRAYALCIIAGIIIAGYWGNRRLVARGGRSGAVTDLAIWMIPFGLVGGRLYHIITDPELYFGDPNVPGHHWNPWGVFAIWNGGLGIWGAIALGALGGYIGARRYKISFGALADALAPGIVLAQGIGRLGNYFNQELFGSPTGVPWGLEVYLRTPGGVAGTAAQCGSGEFPTEWIKSSSDILCGTYHPTFLYELVWDVLIALVVVWADRHFRLGHGRAFALYVAGYTVGRGWIEMLRIDHANHILGLRLNVFVAAAVCLAAIVYLIVTRHRGREDPAEVYGVIPGQAGRGRESGATDDDEFADWDDEFADRDDAEPGDEGVSSGDDRVLTGDADTPPGDESTGDESTGRGDEADQDGSATSGARDAVGDPAPGADDPAPGTDESAPGADDPAPGADESAPGADDPAPRD